MTRLCKTGVLALGLFLLAAVQQAVGATDPRELVRDTSERVLGEMPLNTFFRCSATVTGS